MCSISIKIIVMSCMLSWLADDHDSTWCPPRLTEFAPNYSIWNCILSHFYYVTHYTSLSAFVTMTQKKIFPVFYTCNSPKSNHSYPKMFFYNTYYAWQLSLSDHDHDTICSLRNIFLSPPIFQSLLNFPRAVTAKRIHEK